MIDPHRQLRIIDFFRPLQMLKYPSVSLPTLYYAVSFGWGSILFIISSANIFAKTYHFKPHQTGVLLGVPLTVGSLLGEMLSGAFSDWICSRRALARGGARKPEDRLFALGPAIILLPLGLIIEGVWIERMTHWSGVGMGIAIASFGLQIASTIVYTYTNEVRSTFHFASSKSHDCSSSFADEDMQCYRPQAADIGTLLNFCRQIFGFCVGFYAVDLGERIGFQNAWIVFAFVNLAVSLPILILILKGEQWRKTLGVPDFHKDL